MTQLFLIFLGILFVTSAYPAEVKFAEMDNLSQMEIELRLSEAEATPVAVKKAGSTFYRLPIENEGFYFGQEGKPELPTLHRWLAVSSNSQYQLEISPGSYKTYKNILLYPAQPDSIETELPKFRWSKRAYSKNRWYGKKTVGLGTRIQLGAATLLPISFSPVAYNPVLKELRVYENVKVRLINVSAKPIDEPVEISQFAAEQISSLTLNGKRFLEKNGRVARNRKVLIAYAPGFAAWSERFAKLYEADGMSVIQVEVPSSIKPDTLKTTLSLEYQKHQLDSVLILGDEKAIPLKDSGGRTGDFSYSLLAGNDQVSDAAVGRYPIKNEIQAQIIFNKVKRYRDLSLRGYQNKRVMLIAHAQDYPGKYTRNMETVRKSPNPLELEFNTQYGGEEGKNASVLEEAQKGYAIINYRGHGSASSWTGWGSDGASFSTSQVKALPEQDTALSFIFNVACTNGAIQNSSPVIAERELFPNENPESLQGAVGTFGATAPSLTEVNHRFNLSLFNFLQNSQNISVGNIYTLANNQLTKDNGGSATSNTRMYILFSDPVLSPWIR